MASYRRNVGVGVELDVEGPEVGADEEDAFGSDMASCRLLVLVIGEREEEG